MKKNTLLRHKKVNYRLFEIQNGSNLTFFKKKGYCICFALFFCSHLQKHKKNGKHARYILYEKKTWVRLT